VLYIMMGVAAFVVWRAYRTLPDLLVTTALVLFAVQLTLNFAWSPVFFGMQWILGGLVIIVPMWLAIVATTFSFFRVSTLAGALMLPYLAWVTFATYLNAGLLAVNR